MTVNANAVTAPSCSRPDFGAVVNALAQPAAYYSGGACPSTKTKIVEKNVGNLSRAGLVSFIEESETDMGMHVVHHLLKIGEQFKECECYA